jgi:hypothetical protein
MVIQVRERAAIEGMTPAEWIRQAIADRLGLLDPPVLRVGNPNFKPKGDLDDSVSIEIVDLTEVDPVDSALKIFGE